MFILLQDLLNKIWSFMESEPPLNPLLARWETVHSRTAKYITLAINTILKKEQTNWIKANQWQPTDMIFWAC